MERTISITITVDPKEEMFSVTTTEGESGFYTDFGPTPLWSDWRPALIKQVGEEVASWVTMMADEAEDCDEDECEKKTIIDVMYEQYVHDKYLPDEEDEE